MINMMNRTLVKEYEETFENLSKGAAKIYVFLAAFDPIAIKLIQGIGINIRGFIDGNMNLKERIKGINVYTFDEFLTMENSNTFILVVNGNKTYSKPQTLSIQEKDMVFEFPSVCVSREILQHIYDKKLTESFIKSCQEINPWQSYLSVGFSFARGMNFITECPFMFTFINEDMRPMPSFNITDTAMIMQGPIIYEDDFTLKAALWYRKLYPLAPMIISTWNGEGTVEFTNKCKDNNILVIEGDYPEKSGFMNVNYQLTSSRRGIEYAKANFSVKYAVKLRTDQRIYKPDFLMDWRNLLKLYPSCGEKLRCRLIFPGGFLLIPFHLTDFFYFGHIDDMLDLFSISLMEDNPKYNVDDNWFGDLYCRKIEPMSSKPLKEIYLSPEIRKHMENLSNYVAPEMYITERFFEKKIKKINWQDALGDYWRFLRDYAVVVDRQTLLLHWPKRDFDHYVLPTIYRDIGQDTLSHSRWIDLYLNSRDWME